MPFPPIQPNDFFDAASLVGLQPAQAAGFQGEIGPGATGLGTRQSRVQPGRPAVSTRKLIHWLVPEGPIVQMYINPQNITSNYKKGVAPQRTKGGYIVQYWGEELTTLNISGTTGTSGIEGINVLYDIYRNEQLAFDPYALFLAKQLEQDAAASGAGQLTSSIFGSGAGNIVEGLLGSSQSFTPTPREAPSLASLAFTVELYHSGIVYRGWFTDFTVTESAQELGMFNYQMTFVVSQIRGMRSNFMPWHKSATHGQSNSNPIYGPPHSFGSLVSGTSPGVRLENNANQITGIESSINSIENSLNTIF